MSSDHTFQPKKALIWLFKTPASSSHDTYAAALDLAGYAHAYIPVLKETFETSELETVIQDGSRNWDGVIITSKRGAEGWIQAARRAAASSLGAYDFSAIPLYSVGSTSIEALLSSGLPRRYVPDLSRAVTAKSVSVLLEDMLANTSHRARSFLFIRGDKSTDELQGALRGAGHIVHEVQVYATLPDPELSKAVSQQIDELQGMMPESHNGFTTEGREAKDIWLAFFSPSSADYALPYFDELLHTKDSRCRVRVFAIGETTRSHLLAKGYQVDATAEEPNATGLVSAIRQAG